MKHFNFFATYHQKSGVSVAAVPLFRSWKNLHNEQAVRYPRFTAGHLLLLCFCLCLLNFPGSKSTKTSSANAFSTICLPQCNILPMKGGAWGKQRYEIILEVQGFFFIFFKKNKWHLISGKTQKTQSSSWWTVSMRWNSPLK